MKKGIVAIIILATIPFFFGSVPHARAYTSPGKATGYVNDFAGIIPTDQKTALETTLSNFEKETGDQIAVVTVPTLGDETVESYAVKLFQEWGIGQKNKDNGVLLLIGYQEHKIRIEVGYGLEEYLTDAQSAAIIRNTLTPAFKSGDYGGGITSAVQTMMGVLRQDPTAIADTNTDVSPSADNIFGFLYFLIFIPLWLGSALARSKSWWAGGVIGVVLGIIAGFISGIIIGIIAVIVLGIVGLIFDYIVSTAYASRVSRGLPPPWWIGGRGFGGRGGGGGFGGFGGGGSGGGGASGGW